MGLLKAFGAVVVIALFASGKYWQMKGIEERKVHKSGIQTLFSGEK